MAENVNVSFPGPTSSWDVGLLFIALLIDLADYLPFNVPGAACEALFLMYLGTPPARSIVRGFTEIVPILNWIPWCTLTVLHKKYGLNLGRLSPLFNK